MPIRIYTKTGDQGETGLFGGGRVPKDHPRTTAYGEIDELNSTLGVVRATPPVDFHDALLESIQRDLFSIGGHLATPDPVKVAKALEKADLSEERVALFERVMDDADAELPPLRAFVLPAGTQKAAALHLARTVCRRAERSVVSLSRRERRSSALPRLSQPALRSPVHSGSPREPSVRHGGRHLVSRSPVIVTHALGHYPVYVEPGVLGRLESLSETHLGTGHVTMIADASVYELLQTGRLSRAQWNGDAITFPAGEDSKNRKEWARITDLLLDRGRWARRRDHRPRRRRRRRPRGLRGRHLSARDPVPPSTDIAARHGGRVGRRKDRRGHETREEPGRRVSSTGGGGRRSARAPNPARSRLSGWPGGSGEAWTDRGPRVLRVDGA